MDLFLQNVKLQGEAVRKSGKKLAASVLVKKEGRSEQTRLGATSDSMLSELVVSLQGANQPGEEFHLKVSVGEIVIIEVTKCTRNERLLNQSFMQIVFHYYELLSLGRPFFNIQIV